MQLIETTESFIDVSYMFIYFYNKLEYQPSFAQEIKLWYTLSFYQLINSLPP